MARDDKEVLVSNLHESNDQDHLPNQIDLPDQIDHVSIDSSHQKTTSQLVAFLITINVTIGAGLLAMPFGMRESSLIFSLVWQTFLLTLIIGTCIMCTHMAIASNSQSYDQIVKTYSKPFFYSLTQAIIFLLVYGTIIAYIVMIGDQADRLCKNFSDQSDKNDTCSIPHLNKYVMIIGTVVLILPLCLPKSIDFLKYGSSLGFLSNFLIIWVAIKEYSTHDRAPDINYYQYSKYTDTLTIIPIVCLAYQCHLSWIPVAATLPKEQKTKTCINVTLVMIVSCIIYTSVSILTLFRFGNATRMDLIESYTDKGWLIQLTIAVVAIKCIVTMPCVLLPLRLSLMDFLKAKSEKFSNLSEPYQRISVTVVTILSALIISIFVPDIMTAVNMLGFLCVFPIFFFPALCYRQYMREEPEDQRTWRKTRLFLTWFILYFSTKLMIVVLFKSIQKLICKTSDDPNFKPPVDQPWICKI